VFAVGNAISGSNNAIRRSQVEALFPSFLGAGAAISGISVGASPFAYTATTGGSVAVAGGTVSGITLTRSSTTVPVGTQGAIFARNGDVVTVTYSVAPTMNFIPL
jgi:hypothetical protein